MSYFRRAMGRGGGQELGNGEIALLDADRITDHTDQAAPDVQSASGFGNDHDDRAIARLREKLASAPSSRGLDPDAIEDRAIDLYNRSCDLIRSGRASAEQVAKIAALFGEEPAALQTRLREESSSEDLVGDGGAWGLLRALGG